MSRCLYADDYGPPTPGFTVGVLGGELAAHRAELERARNQGQLEAMKRQILRGEPIQWCAPGYGWVESPLTFDTVITLAAAVMAAYLSRRVRSDRCARLRQHVILAEE